MTAPRLAPSQTRLLRQIVSGLRYREIAEASYRSKVHLVDQAAMRLRRRLGARTNAEMVARAVAEGLVIVEPRP